MEPDQQTQTPQPNLQSQVNPPYESNNTSSRNWLKIVLIIILLILFGIGGYFLERNHIIPNQSNPQACTQDVKKCPDGSYVSRTGPNCEFSPCPIVKSPTPTIDPSANWKIYTNTKYNYQLRYPPTWLVQAMSGNEQLNQTPAANFRTNIDKTPAESGFSLSVISNPKNLSLTDWIKQNPDNGVLLLGTNSINSFFISINGLRWEKIDDNSIGYVPTGYVKYGLAHGGNLYYIVSYSTDVKTIDQILSTFKFIDQTSDNINNRKLCQSDSDCNSDEFCTTVGPIAINPTTGQTLKNMYCWKKGAPVPL